MDNHGRIFCDIFQIISVFWPGYGKKTVFRQLLVVRPTVAAEAARATSYGHAASAWTPSTVPPRAL